jgi:hypothetical protein
MKYIAAVLLICGLAACGQKSTVPHTLAYCDKNESFNVYPANTPFDTALGKPATGLPDGNFPIVVGRAPSDARVVVYEITATSTLWDAPIYGTTFAKLSGPVPSPSNPISPDDSDAVLSESVVPSLKPNTTYFWTLSNATNPAGCHAYGSFTTK